MSVFYLFITWVLLFFILCLTTASLATICFFTDLYRASRQQRVKDGNEESRVSKSVQRSVNQKDKSKKKLCKSVILTSSKVTKGQQKGKLVKGEVDEPDSDPLSRRRTSLEKAIAYGAIYAKGSRFHEGNIMSGSSISLTTGGHSSHNNTGDYQYVSSEMIDHNLSCESIETVTTISDFYRDWRHSMDFNNFLVPANKKQFDNNMNVLRI